MDRSQQIGILGNERKISERAAEAQWFLSCFKYTSVVSATDLF